MDTNVLNINGLTKNYKKFSLGPLDLQIEKGTAVAIVGANGSGKSTLFRLLMNVLQPEAGSIEWFGQNLLRKETEIKGEVGYVGDMLEPFGHLKIKELAALVSHWFPSWDEKYYSQLIKRYQVDEEVKFGKSSKGTKKKVELVLAMSHRPSVLLLDEPSAGLDISSQRKMKEDLISFMEDGEKSIILATHNVEEVKQICDFITILRDGKEVCTFMKDDIYDNWGRIWVEKFPQGLKNNPNIIAYEENPPQIVTNNIREMEDLLQTEQVRIINMQRVNLEEVIEYFVDTEQ
ncbi:ABC-2 type transport system ATP-binding protein [Evansella vedderi]|uniref:ABC-2 type transport system ATP-binding protein n=1 Tax=Evansella vedderi TaxID=38282 RepID=A0ABT9ZRU9_9BACI|nr:ABC transporter ATP-binding protein [Evansella vedderi]MDQ0253466.1 ABC-2 type transport system ATP-binding protein [Evansella vedderi]